MSLFDKVARFFLDADKAHQIVHGDANTTVTTDGGPVRSLAKLVADNQAAIDAQAPSLAQLAAVGGAGLVMHGTESVASELAALQLADYPALRAYAGARKSVYVVASGIAGMFVRDDADTTTADNGGTVIVASNGKRWKRRFDGAINSAWFGVVCDGVTDSTSALNSAIQYAKSSGLKCVTVPPGNMKTSGSITVGGNFGEGFELRGHRTTITATANAPVIVIDARNPDSAPEVRIHALVHGFDIIGPGKSNTSSSAIQAQHGANVHVKDCTLKNCYRGLYGYGNLISQYENLFIENCAYGIDLAIDSEFAPNDLHFSRCQIISNDKAIRAVGFPNGAVTFSGCEIESNNASGNTTDGVRVVEFSQAGKVTMIGCHMEANPGQYNIYFDGTAGTHLNVIGGEMIPGDSCKNVIYMDNVSGGGALFLVGCRATNNNTGLGQEQIHISTGAKATIINSFSGALTGDPSQTTWIEQGRVTLGRQDPLAGGNGITFPATQNPSTDPNTLDDYKEGTWTPTVVGQSTAGTATYTAQNGRYTKIGRQVFVECWVNWSGGTGTGDLAIAGLPFTVAASSTYPAANIARTNNLTWTAGSIPRANFNPGANNILFFQEPSGGGAVATIPYKASAYIMVSGTYTV
jgi:hypothetical protein